MKNLNLLAKVSLIYMSCSFTSSAQTETKIGALLAYGTEVKTIHHFKAIFSTLLLLSLFACSSNDDPSDEETTHGESYISYSVNGSAVNGTFSISTLEETNDYHVNILGNIHNEETDEGTVEVAYLIFSSFEGTDENYKDVTMVLPSHTGSLALGEIVTGSTGITTELPTFNMQLSFDEEAFYDTDGDGDNDLLTHLLSKNITGSITEIEQTYNSLGILTLAHIKGSFEGEAYFKEFTGGTTEPEVVLQTVTGDFEYNLPIE